MKPDFKALKNVAVPCLCGVFLVAVMGLLGYLPGLRIVSSIRDSYIPMAPSTSLSFIILTVILFFRVIHPEKRAGLFSHIMTVPVLLFGMIKFAGFFIHTGIDFERWIFPVTGHLNGIPIGQMSPATGFCFLVSGIAVLLLVLRQKTPARLIYLPGTLGVLTFVIGTVYALTYLYGDPLMYGHGSTVPMALTTAIGFVLLGVAIAGTAVRFKTAVLYISGFIVLAAGVVTTGYLSYQNYARNYRTAAGRQLLTIAELKVSELVQYRKERLGDGSTFYKNPVFYRLVRRFFEDPSDTDTRQLLEAWLGKTQDYNKYIRVFLVDTQAVEKLAIPARDRATPDFSKHLAEVLGSGKVTFFDLHRHAPDQPIVFSVLVPVLDESGTNAPLGVLVLQIDPNAYLYPFIQHWPVPSETAEVLLVRRDGDEAVFLNELRFKPNAALNLRIPLSRTDVPAVKAVLGQRGLVRGLDYRSVPVLAAVQAVPDSPWFIVARQDIDEIYAPMYQRFRQVIIMVGVLLFGSGTGIGLAWRHQRVKFYQEKARTAELLRETNDYLENLLNYANAPVIVWNAEGKITRFNHAFEAIAGRKMEEVLGQGLDLLFADDQRERAMAIIRRAGAGERFDLVEVPIQHTNGSSRTVLWNSAPIYDPDGKTQIATIAQGQDITERKRAEELVLRNEKRLNGLVNILQSRAETMQEFLDQALGEALRVTESRFGYIYFYDEETREFTLNSWSKEVMAECAVVNPQTCYELDKTGIWGEAVRQRRPILINDFQSSHPLKKGYPKGHVELTRFATIPVFKADRIVAVVGIANKSSDYDETDVFQLTLLMDTVWKTVEARQTQDELDRTAAILRTAMEQSPAGIAIAEAPSGKLTYVNKAGLEIGGGNDRELVEGVEVDKYVASWNLLDMDGSPLPVEQIPVVQVLQSGQIASREFIIRRRENDDRIVLAKAAPIKNAQLQTTSAVVVFVDITESRRSERRLIETLEQLRESNRDLEQFAYIASHDLQEPLRMVANYVQLLERRYKDRLDQDAKDFIGYAADGAVRMQQLIDSLLEYSRLQTRKKPFEPVNLENVLQQVLRDLEGRILETGAQVTAGPLPQVQGDGIQFGLVFQNLISNALKFRGDAPPEIRISAEEFSSHWKINVRDNGIGIDPAHQERIFKIFQRLHSRADYPGTGIGLAIFKRIIERHGGTTGVESAAEKGSLFWFTLPKKGKG